MQTNPTRAAVLNGTAQIGSRVKHYGQRFTGEATATVTGFSRDQTTGHLMVLVSHDNPSNGYDMPGGWSLDRTELVS